LKICVFGCFYQQVLFEAIVEGFLSDLGYENWYSIYCSPCAIDDENRMILRSLVLTHYQHVMDGQTDG